MDEQDQTPGEAHVPPTPAPEPPAPPPAPPATQQTAPEPIPPTLGTYPVSQEPNPQVPVTPDPVTPESSSSKSGPTTCGVVAIAILVTLIFGTFVGGAAGFAGAWLATEGPSSGSSGGSLTVVSSETDEPVSAAAAVALPSVVNIDVSGEASSDSEEFPDGHPGVPRMGNGSGVAFAESPDGGTFIITNAHVVDGATDIMVTDSERERHVGEIVGSDADSDIAVVKIDADVPLLSLGNSDALQVGQLAVAIGSPYGLSHSVSSGVISAIGRSLPNSVESPSGVYPLVDVIQTDAAINPGNSGGALVDRKGRLVGINSAIYSESGSSGGIGFAVPVNRASAVAEQLIATGDVQYPFLGILGRNVDVMLAEEEDLAVDEGALVVEVTEGTEAEKAGIQEGDVIVTLQGAKILSMDDLILEVRRRTIGETVTIELYRDDELVEMEMTVGIKPDTIDLAPEVPNTEEPPTEE